MLTLAWGAATDVGRVRDHNEDAMYAAPPVFAVADGMGGHAAGEIASSLAIEQMARIARRGGLHADDLVVAVRDANQAILHDGLQHGDRFGMGTTLAGLAVVSAPGTEANAGTERCDPAHQQWLVFNVGDSRVYRYYEGELSQVSVDHSEVEELVSAGRLSPEQALRYPRRNVVTRSLGSYPAPDVDVWALPMTAGERFLLCTDGLNGELRDAEIAALLSADDEPQHTAEDLVAASLAAGGNDNVTVIIVDARTVAQPASPSEANPE